jgi:putative hydrolase of the HAD superfamily
VFDLDDTLHNASAHIFPHLNRAMTEYLMEHLALEETEADALRRHYWHLYGATLKGLMRHHGTNPHHFLHHTHQFPHLQGMIIRARGLRSTLRQLKGRKVIFTNAPVIYAETVLKLLKIRDLFDGVFSIESSRFNPKPSLIGFMRMLRHFRLRAGDCVMVEDTLSALQTAKRLGMKTVYIHPRAKQPPYVDACIRSVLALPRLAVAL